MGVLAPCLQVEAEELHAYSPHPDLYGSLTSGAHLREGCLCCWVWDCLGLGIKWRGFLPFFVLLPFCIVLVVRGFVSSL